MHSFGYKDGVLHCEDISLMDVAKEFKTPFYLYSYETLIDHFSKLEDAFRPLDPLICFSMKSNSNLSVCKALVEKGAGLDIVSGGELYKAGLVGCSPEKTVYASVGKTREEIRDAIKKSILFFNVESVPELVMIDSVAKKMREKARVAIRLNPDVAPDTHDYITTGTKEKKFGVDFKTAEDIFDNANRYSNLSIEAVHVHIGSQITDTKPFAESLKKVLDFLEKSKIQINYLNIGGGFGIVYKKEKASTAQDFADAMIPLLKDKPFKFILEPGRFISGNAGILVCKVVYVKTGASDKHFAIVDAGMNDLIRPSLYNAYHEVLPLVERKTETVKYDIVGPICESGDYLALDRNMQELLPGEYLAVMGAGAYGYVMSSNYNSRTRPAELMVYNGSVRVIRSAENKRDLIRGEKIVKEFK